MQTTIRLPEQLHDRAKQMAREQGITFNALVVMALWKFLAAHTASNKEKKKGGLHEQK